MCTCMYVCTAKNSWALTASVDNKISEKYTKS